jgi:hypothetical protein
MVTVTLAATMAVMARDGRNLSDASILAELERKYGGSEARKRSRSLPDTRAVIRDAVADMKVTGTRRTWKATAARISERTGVYVAESTLRAWCTEDRLPHPGQPYWDAPGTDRLAAN